MIKIVAAVAGAVVLTGAVVLLSGMTPIRASAVAPQINVTAKGDRLDIRTYGAECSEHGWPYYEASCVRHSGEAKAIAKPVRIVTTDRLPANILAEFAPAR